MSPAQAEEAALRHSEGGTITRRNQRRKDGREVYEYRILNGDWRITLRLDAEDGSMLKYEKAPVAKGGGRRDHGEEETKILSLQEAAAIALERSGGGMVVESERENKRDGRVYYEMEIHKDGMEYEMVVDGVTGEIVKYQEERIGR